MKNKNNYNFFHFLKDICKKINASKIVKSLMRYFFILIVEYQFIVFNIYRNRFLFVNMS